MRARKSRLPSPIKMASQNRPAMANTRLSGVSRPICISLPATAAIMAGLPPQRPCTASVKRLLQPLSTTTVLTQGRASPATSPSRSWTLALVVLDGQQAARPCQRHRGA